MPARFTVPSVQIDVSASVAWSIFWTTVVHVTVLSVHKRAKSEERRTEGGGIRAGRTKSGEQTARGHQERLTER